jgi:hypothetical protein
MANKVLLIIIIHLLQPSGFMAKQDFLSGINTHYIKQFELVNNYGWKYSITLNHTGPGCQNWF